MINELINICNNNYKLLFAVAVFVLIDTVLGILKAITNKEFTFTSNGLRKALPKMIEYFCGIVLGITIEFVSGKHITSLIAVSIMITEAVSIKENITAVPILAKIIDWFIARIKVDYKLEDDNVTGELDD